MAPREGLQARLQPHAPLHLQVILWNALSSTHGAGIRSAWMPAFGRSRPIRVSPSLLSTRNLLPRNLCCYVTHHDSKFGCSRAAWYGSPICLRYSNSHYPCVGGIGFSLTPTILPYSQRCGGLSHFCNISSTKELATYDAFALVSSSDTAISATWCITVQPLPYRGPRSPRGLSWYQYRLLSRSVSIRTLFRNGSGNISPALPFEYLVNKSLL